MKHKRGNKVAANKGIKYKNKQGNKVFKKLRLAVNANGAAAIELKKEKNRKKSLKLIISVILRATAILLYLK